MQEKRDIFEYWESKDKESTVFTSRTNIEKDSSLLDDNDELIHVIVASTWEEANAILHIREGRESYIPNGEAVPCPNNCGAYLYPEHTNECPYCT